MYLIVIIVQVFLVITSNSENYYTNECQNDWFNYKNQKCVKVWNQSKVNYTDAISKCRSLNASLVTIGSEEENLFFTSLLYDLEPEVKGLYIGLKRKVQNNSYLNEFEWTDGSDPKYENWALGEPTPWFEPCTEMYAVDINAGKWNDLFCTGLRYAMCQQLIYQNTSNEYKPEFELCERLDYVSYRNNCYKAYNQYSALNWTAAELRCKEDNASLLYIEDSYEHSFIKYWTQSSLKTFEFWIGLTAKDNPQNIRYEWVSEWPVYYTAWDSGQPKFQVTALKQCVVQDRESGLWRSDPYCHDRRAFVCKISDHKVTGIQTYVSAICPVFNNPTKGQTSEEWINLHKNLKHCHWFSDSLATNWSDASKRCHNRKGNLVSIHSRHESELLKPILQKYGRPLWLGLYQSPGGFYRWDDGSDLDFKNWFPGEPTDEKGELCVEMRAQDMTWNDIHCSGRELQFICEINKIQTNYSIIHIKMLNTNTTKSDVSPVNESSSGQSSMRWSTPVMWLIAVILLIAIALSFVAYFWSEKITEFYTEFSVCPSFLNTGFNVDSSGVNSQRSSVNERNVFDISNIH